MEFFIVSEVRTRHQQLRDWLGDVDDYLAEPENVTGKVVNKTNFSQNMNNALKETLQTNPEVFNAVLNKYWNEIIAFLDSGTLTGDLLE